jgi:hypothetical protein
MGINQIHLASSPIFPESLKAIGRVSKTSAWAAIARTGGSEEVVRIEVRSQAELAALQKVDEKMNSLAKSRRFYQGQLQQMDDSIERMKAQLEKLLKQFPPYPPGSEDRMRTLRAYAGCRQLIDQLTIPPPEEFFPQMTEDAAIVAKPPEAEDITEPMPVS